MLFLNADLPFKNCLTDRLIQLRFLQFLQFCSQSGSSFDQPVVIKSCKVSAKVTCMCPCTQENLEFLATTVKANVLFI